MKDSRENVTEIILYVVFVLECGCVVEQFSFNAAALDWLFKNNDVVV